MDKICKNEVPGNGKYLILVQRFCKRLLRVIWQKWFTVYTREYF